MRNTQNTKKANNLFFRGCSYDTNIDFSSAKEGFYRDANNMRLYTGNYSIKRINGESLKYYSTDKSYTCIGTAEINNNILEVWVNNYSNLLRFRVNGSLMLETDQLTTFTKNTPLQIHKADDCSEGLFFITNRIETPYIFSILDIINNYNDSTQKYFTAFNPELYSVNVTTYNNIPVFRSLTSGSLTVGKYSYAIRFVTEDGDRTIFSLPTPMIPVPMSTDKGSNAHPYNSTHGGTLETSPFGIKIQFRVNNNLNYKYIEILRIKSNTLQGLNETQTAEYTPIFPELEENEISVRTFIDDGSIDSSGSWIPLTDEESTDTMATIKSCQSLRYYNNRLYLANVELVSKSVSDDITFDTYYDSKAFPFIDNLGEIGYSSSYNSAYKTSYMGGEKYGFGVLCLDSQGNACFVVPVKDDVVNFTNYKFPDRRERVNNATDELSRKNWKGIPMATDTNNNTDKPLVHEKFSKNEVRKTPYPRGIRQELYHPYTPVTYDDTDVIGLGLSPNRRVSTIMEGGIASLVHTFNYNPDFSYDIYAMGIAIAGISNLPNYVKAFSIVRTKPAGRVVCQGISTYTLNDTDINIPAVQSGLTAITPTVMQKQLDGVSFFSDEIKGGYVGAYTNNYFTKYKYQTVSPLGYFSEVYSGTRKSIDLTLSSEFGRYSQNIDTILYAREYVTDPNYPTSPYLFDRNNIINGDSSRYWTKFGKWRNKEEDIFDYDTGSKFNITSDINYNFKNVGFDGHVRLTFDRNIYKNASPQSVKLNSSYEQNCNNEATQNFHEPFYIGNIIDEDKNVTELNQQEYILTGHYQKIESNIGIGNDEAQDILLVDERFEDCCVNQYNPIRPTYIYIKNAITNIEKAWVDITMYNNSIANYDTTVITALQTNGYYESTDPITGETVTCYGAYRHEIGSSTVETGDWTIKFEQINNLDKKYCIPANNDIILVKYDNRFPLKVFGGDTIIGESIFALVDGQSDSNGNIKNNKQLYAFTGFPYAGYELYEQLYSTKDSSTETQKIFPMSIFRQLLVSSIVESRIHLPYAYQQKSSTEYSRGNNFPRVHYIIRPHSWVTTDIATSNFGTNKIDTQYLTDYPKEYNYWDRGGFRSIQGYNIDYSKSNNYNRFFSKPTVGYTEKTSFCSRTMWSLTKNINVQDSPNLRTFLSLNYYDISDAYGGIKYLYDNDSSKGNNLIAITEKGICLLITDKRTISDINSNELFVLDSDRVIKGQYWLSKNIGCNNDMWRGIAEYGNIAFIPNSESIYMLQGLEIKDILRNNKGSYYEKLHPILEAITNNTTVSAVYNISNNEYWLYVGSIDDIFDIRDVETGETGEDEVVDVITKSKLLKGDITFQELVDIDTIGREYGGYVYVYKTDLEAFTGTFEYRGDKFLSIKGQTNSKELKVLLMRNYETYETNIGNTLNGESIEGNVMYVVAPELTLFKEFIDMTINSSLCPSRIELSNTKNTIEATQTHFKDYGAWYTMTPRKDETKVRFQGRALIVDIYNSDTGVFELSSIETGYKIIK